MKENDLFSTSMAEIIDNRQKSIIGQEEDYAELLKPYTLDYQVDDYHIHIGRPKISQGWILHISVIKTQIGECIRLIIPELLASELPFKLVKNQKIHSDTNDGFYGDFKIGKIFTVYLENETKIIPLVKKLVPLTEKFIGPQILTDFPLHNNIYTRYGTFIPIIDIDGLGNKVRLIKDINGRFFYDKYYLPPIIPYGIPNPFLPIIEEMPKPPKIHLVANKYMLVKLLKSDTKGDVYKALYFSKYLLPKWCVLKQGRKGMFIDDIGRDARDRIRWQYKIGKAFQHFSSIPKSIDHWEDDNQSYLAIKYITGGKDLKWLISNKSKHRAWFDQPLKIKKQLLGYLIQVVSSIKIIHEQGYVHRDITGTNFLVTRNNKIRLIDLELIYSYKQKEPSPPFRVGTIGYMSPEQRETKTPCCSDDSYSLGSFMILIFSGGIEPVHLLDINYQLLRLKLMYLIRNDRIVGLILKCLSIFPSDRPNVEYIYEQLLSYLNSITKADNITLSNPEQDKHKIKITIDHSINMLASDLMAHEQKWFSQVENVYGNDVYPLFDKDIFGGIYRGIGGPIWLLGKLNKLGYDISNARNNIANSCCFFQVNVLQSLEKYAPSFYYGKAGFALVLSTAIQSGFIADTLQIRDKIKECFQDTATSFDVIYGISGQGLAIMQCSEYLGDYFVQEKLSEYTTRLSNAQLADGSWARVDLGSDNVGNKETGMGYGMAGIIYYLLEYGFRYRKSSVIQQAEKGLSYLTSQTKKTKEYYAWFDNDKTKSIGIWWCKGGPGIALSYLKAFEITKNPLYKTIAEKALAINPRYITHHVLGQCHGLSGLGEIYLEAFRITQNEEWLYRASWIANLLLAFKKEGPNNSIYWIVDRLDFPTADFMIGNSGIVHFLARYYSPLKIGFPLLSI